MENKERKQILHGAMVGVVMLLVMALISVRTELAAAKNQLSQTKAQAEIWEKSFHSFYGYAKKDWSMALPYADMAIKNSWSQVLARDHGWGQREKISWEVNCGPAVTKRILGE